MGMLSSEGHAKDETRCYTWPTLHSVQFRISGQNIRDRDEDGDDAGGGCVESNDEEDGEGDDIDNGNECDNDHDTGAGGNDDDDFVDLLLKIVYSFTFLFRVAAVCCSHGHLKYRLELSRDSPFSIF